MNFVYFLCGVPYSGKTTFAENHFENCQHLSRDHIIQKIATMCSQSYMEVYEDLKLFSETQVVREIQQAIKRNRDIVLDECNISVAIRKKRLDLFNNSYRKIIYVFPNPDQATLEARQRTRGKYIPDDVVTGMIANFQMPTLEEGFDEIRPYYGNV